MYNAEASKLIAEQLKIAEEALKKAQAISNEHKVEFYWSGPEYGMGGYYFPLDWESSSVGWQPSTASC